MGEKQDQLSHLSFNACLKANFQGWRKSGTAPGPRPYPDFYERPRLISEATFSSRWRLTRGLPAPGSESRIPRLP